MSLNCTTHTQNWLFLLLCIPQYYVAWPHNICFSKFIHFQYKSHLRCVCHICFLCLWLICQSNLRKIENQSKIDFLTSRFRWCCRYAISLHKLSCTCTPTAPYVQKQNTTHLSELYTKCYKILYNIILKIRMLSLTKTTIYTGQWCVSNYQNLRKTLRPLYCQKIITIVKWLLNASHLNRRHLILEWESKNTPIPILQQ